MAYKYLRDPLFLFCFALYFANRWLFKPYLPNTFSQCYLNDLICIPFWVPIMLYFLRRLHLRADDAPPQSYEILIPLVLWSLIFELWLPYTPLLQGRAISDHTDILFYTLGGLLASLFWRRWYRVKTPAGCGRDWAAIRTDLGGGNPRQVSGNRPRLCNS